MRNPSGIRNKAKRQEVYAKYKLQKRKLKKKLRAERIKDVEALGESAPPKQANICHFFNTNVLNDLYRCQELWKILEKLMKLL